MKLTLVLSTPVNAMLKHRFDLNQHGQVTDTAVVKKPKKLLPRVESLEERFRLLELQVYSNLDEKQESPLESKPDQNLKNLSTPSTLRRWFSIKNKKPEGTSPTTPTPPIAPVISAPLTSTNLPKAKPVVAPPPPPPLQDNLLLFYVAEQPGSKKSFMEEPQHKKLKPPEEKKKCSSPESDVQGDLMREMMSKKLQTPMGERKIIQTPVSSQPNELDKKLARRRQLIDQF